MEAIQFIKRPKNLKLHLYLFRIASRDDFWSVSSYDGGQIASRTT